MARATPSPGSSPSRWQASWSCTSTAAAADGTLTPPLPLPSPLSRPVTRRLIRTSAGRHPLRGHSPASRPTGHTPASRPTGHSPASLMTRRLPASLMTRRLPATSGRCPATVGPASGIHEDCVGFGYHIRGQIPHAHSISCAGARPLGGEARGHYLGAKCVAGLFHVIDAYHGEEHIVGDADRQQQVSVDARIGERAECRRAGAWLVFHPDGQRRAHRVPEPSVLECCLSGGLIVCDKRNGAFVPVGRRGQDQVDAVRGHSLAYPGKLPGLIFQVDGEHAHLLPLSRSPAPFPASLSRGDADWPVRPDRRGPPGSWCP